MLKIVVYEFRHFVQSNLENFSGQNGLVQTVAEQRRGRKSIPTCP